MRVCEKTAVSFVSGHIYIARAAHVQNENKSTIIVIKKKNNTALSVFLSFTPFPSTHDTADTRCTNKERGSRLQLKKAHSHMRVWCVFKLSHSCPIYLPQRRSRRYERPKLWVHPQDVQFSAPTGSLYICIHEQDILMSRVIHKTCTPRPQDNATSSSFPGALIP